MGSGRRGGGGACGSAGSTAPRSRARSCRRSRRFARRPARRRRRPRRARRHGRLVAGPRGHRRDLRRRAHHPRHHRSGPGRRRAERPARHARSLVVSSKSGGTLETDSHRRAYEEAFTAAGIDPAERIVVVTDPGSPLHTTATEAGYRVFEADPNIGGRYSALSAFGLVPTGLAGVPDRRAARPGRRARAARWPATTTTPRSHSVRRSAASAPPATTRSCIADAGSGIVGFGDWAEQLIAESTGKSGRGLLPVVVGTHRRRPASPHAPTPIWSPSAATAGGVRHERSAVRSARSSCSGSSPPRSPARSSGSTRSTSRTSQESKDNTKAVLDKAGDGPLPEGEPAFVDGAIEVHGDADAARRRGRHRRRASRHCCAAIPDHGYLAVMAYLDRIHDAAAAELRDALAAADRASGDVRLGAALPALDRPVPQGRPAGRGVPADHRRERVRHRGARPAVLVRPAAARPGARRQPGDRAAAAGRSSACT